MFRRGGLKKQNSVREIVRIIFVISILTSPAKFVEKSFRILQAERAVYFAGVIVRGNLELEKGKGAGDVIICRRQSVVEILAEQLEIGFGSSKIQNANVADLPVLNTVWTSII